MKAITIPQRFAAIIDKISKTAKSANVETYAVGGFVRDIFLNREPKDLDIMVEDKNDKGNARAGIEFAGALAGKYGLSDPVIFERFGTAKLFMDGEEVEFIMPRKEYYCADSRNPDTEIGSLGQDALRRDFTVNALFLRLSDMDVLDLTGKGFDDIHNKIIRVTDPVNAEIIFAQDPLRILRAVRQKFQLGFEIESLTFEAMKTSSSRIHIVAPERIRDEINKILVQKKPSEAFYMMKEIGLLSEILPEIEALYGLGQPEKYHNDGVFEHTFKVLDRTNSDLLLRMAALLHDAGKLKACKNEEGKISFYGHEIYGAQIAGKILKRLRYPKEFAGKTVNIVRNHMRPKNYNCRWKDSALRRFAADCGQETDYVLKLAKADYGKDAADNNVFEFSERLENLNKRGLLYLKKELVSGGELMKYFALAGGDWIKKAKECIADARFENPALTKDEALRLVKEMLNKSGRRA